MFGIGENNADLLSVPVLSGEALRTSVPSVYGGGDNMVHTGQAEGNAI